jgi:hypothetical protein
MEGKERNNHQPLFELKVSERKKFFVPLQSIKANINKANEIQP